ncbi:hypothetical protein [Haloferula sargassicola]|uniref:hypothetical protein n=1 Tax=Haloferula sargassicola TaxID=490096 RepID=UPI003365682B
MNTFETTSIATVFQPIMTVHLVAIRDSGKPTKLPRFGHCRRTQVAVPFGGKRFDP